MCSEEHGSCYQNFHAKGISAILATPNSLVDLRAATELFQMGDPLLLQKPIKVYTPTPYSRPTIILLNAPDFDDPWRSCRSVF